MTPTAVPMQFTMQTIEEGVFKGKQFRYTNDTPRKVSVIDWIQAVTGHAKQQATNLFNRTISANEDVKPKMVYLHFEGQGQRPTPCTDAQGLLFILDKLPRKYVGRFQAERDHLLARYLGGDTSLGFEVKSIRQAQQKIDPEHPMRVFGEAVESGQVGNLNHKAVDLAKVEWHSTRLDAKDATKAKCAAIKSAMPNAKAPMYISNNCAIGRAVTGENPGVFKRKRGIPKYKSARDYMTKEQLTGVKMLEHATDTLAKEMVTQAEFQDKFAKLTDLMYEFCLVGGVHGASIKRPPTLNSNERQELQNQRVADRIEDTTKRQRLESLPNQNNNTMNATSMTVNNYY